MRCPNCQSENAENSRTCSRCLSPLPPSDSRLFDKTMTYPMLPADFARGQVFAGRYEIIEVLGSGGMGTIFRVYDRETREEIAVKILSPEVAADEKTIERFRNELKLARKISHKNVCRMYDLNEEAGTYYIAMEYISGETLKSMIRMTGQLSLGTAVRIARDLGEGLAEAHRLGIIHRDLKPGNIMIDREGSARILDFGIARSLQAQAPGGAEGVIGTPEYMSPEQVEGREADQRSDIYSLGAVLYEMVTGQRPFSGGSRWEISLKRRYERPRDPREANPLVPEELSRLILHCLEKEREKRPQSAEELLAELDAIEDLIPTTEKSVPGKKTGRQKTVVIPLRVLFRYLTAVAAMVLIAILAGRYLRMGRGRAVDSIAVLPFENVNADSELESLSDGITESIIGKLTQLPGLKKVIARSSVFRYKGKSIDPQTVGRELAVDAVLVSRIDNRGEQLTISVELMKVQDNSRLWGNQYKVQVADIFAVEEKITGSIVENMRLRLSGEQKNLIGKRYTENSQAFIAYSKGSFFWNKRTQADLERAIEYFNEAIRLDSHYALPYAGLAYCYILIPEYGGSAPIETYPKAKDAALKGLAIDSRLSEAHVCLAQLKWRYDRDWPAAEREYKMAIALDPGNATAHHWYGFDLMCFERYDEAIAEIRRALELDPRSLVINRNLGQAFLRAGRYEEARQALATTLEMDPHFSFTHYYLGLIQLQEANYQEALSEFLKEKDLAKGWEARPEAYIGVTYIRLGQREKAREILGAMEKRSKQAFVPPHVLAILYFALGENDRGFEWMGKAYDAYDSFLRYIRVERQFDSVRADPRFQELLKKMDLAN